jgi:spore coat protein CotH
MSLTVDGKMTARPLGLYVLVEELDSQFSAERFGSKTAAIFKPVTYDLFDDLGPRWADYVPIYDPKTKTTPEQEKRVIEFARLVSHADDPTFARDLAQFLDLREFARFLAGMVLLSSYDGFLSNGQNFYVYLDPRSDQFGFIPWDLDNAWGSFPFVGTSETREWASIWHPCAGRNRFLDRVLQVDAFRTEYRAALEDLLDRVFVPERLEKRIDEVAAAIRRPIAAESSYRRNRFEQAIGTNWIDRAAGGRGGPTGPVHQLKRFIVNRARSVRAQLDGKSEGVVFDGFNGPH